MINWKKGVDTSDGKGRIMILYVVDSMISVNLTVSFYFNDNFLLIL